MNLWQLAVGNKVMLSDGAKAEVVKATSDGKSVRVRFLEAPFKPELAGTERDCLADEVVALEEGRSLWGQRNGRVHNLARGSRDR